MDDHFYDGMLNIKTTGEQKGFTQSVHYHRYEPTPYSALKHLFEQYELKRSDQLVDFGCGKGRLNFYIHHLFNASVTGIEMNQSFYHEAMENRTHYLKKHKKSFEKIHFQCGLAEEYEIDPADNRFYFFNPFSIQIFIRVINNILVSLEKHQREIELILYYPSEDYIYFLENQTPFELREEIILPVLSRYNLNERFLIYKYDNDLKTAED
jgi:SAM-dependent methyltransferase